MHLHSSWPYGTPTVTSGYIWSSTDDGAPNGGEGRFRSAFGLLYQTNMNSSRPLLPT